VGRTTAERSRLTTRLVADALHRVTHSDLALHPDGSGLFEVFRRPAVTRYDVYAVMPFKNRVVTATLTGAEVQALLKTRPETIASGDASRLHAGRTYRVAMADYVARSDYKLPDDRLQDSGRDLRAVVIAYLAAQPRAGASATARLRRGRRRHGYPALRQGMAHRTRSSKRAPINIMNAA
jgi:hypothetical protein